MSKLICLLLSWNIKQLKQFQKVPAIVSKAFKLYLNSTKTCALFKCNLHLINPLIYTSFFGTQQQRLLVAKLQEQQKKF